jgi:hypothetical protein
VRLPIPGADQPQVLTLRSPLIARHHQKTEDARRAVVVGASLSD